MLINSANKIYVKDQPYAAKAQYVLDLMVYGKSYIVLNQTICKKQK